MLRITLPLRLNCIQTRCYCKIPTIGELLQLKETVTLDPDKKVFGVKKLTEKDSVTTETGPAGLVSGRPEEYRRRVARIYQRSKSVMQQGTDNTKEWILEFDNKERWENPTIGWASSGDSLSNIYLEFPCMTAAVRYAEKEGFSWFHQKPPTKKAFKKTYAENFTWNKRTRIYTK